MGNNYELSFPFNAEIDEEGLMDRIWDAEDFAKYFELFISDGIYPNPANCLKVEAGVGLGIKICKGTAFIKGHGYILSDDMFLVVEKADSTNRRIDGVYLRLDNTKRNIEIIYKKGVAAASPVAPSLIRTADIWELALADITVMGNATQLVAANILDKRMDKSVCGVVSNVVTTVDTTDLFNQYDDYMKNKKADWAQKESEALLKLNNTNAIIGGISTNFFTLINNNFDDWSTKLGCRKTFKKTIKSSTEKEIQEQWIVRLDNFVLMEKITKFYLQDGVKYAMETVKTFDREYKVNGNTVIVTGSIASKTTNLKTLEEVIN